MIGFVRGPLAAKTLTAAMVDVGGVGYQLLMSQDALSKLPAVGSEVQVLTYLHVSESAVVLYGFLSEDEKATFERLISVSGVGPKMALAALSAFSPRALADAVAAQDVAQVTKIPGVGKKTAQRIILELKGTLEAPEGGLFAGAGERSVVDDRMAGAAEALLSMGFTAAEAELALKGAPEGATESALVTYALKRLGS